MDRRFGMNLQLAGQGVLGLGLGTAIAALAAIAPGHAEPAPGLAPEVAPSGPLAQAEDGTPVLPFTDVSPDHWAYEALLNLAGIYGCVSGYPDGTFRGEAAVTRNEFAAGLDACLGVLTGLAQQRRAEQDQAMQELIDAMEQSLTDLRQIETELPETP